MTMKQMSAESGISEDVLAELLGEAYGASLNGNAGKYVNDEGEVVFCYSGDVYKRITVNRPAPDGWMSYPELAERLGVIPRDVKACADRYLAENPGWLCKFYCLERSCSCNYMHPELVELVKDELG